MIQAVKIGIKTLGFTGSPAVLGLKSNINKKCLRIC